MHVAGLPMMVDDEDLELNNNQKTKFVKSLS